jgi:hypothetical protein
MAQPKFSAKQAAFIREEYLENSYSIAAMARAYRTSEGTMTAMIDQTGAYAQESQCESTTHQTDTDK